MDSGQYDHLIHWNLLRSYFSPAPQEDPIVPGYFSGNFLLLFFFEVMNA